MFRAVIYFKFYNSLFIWNQIYYVDRLWCIELPWFMVLSWRAAGLHVTLSLKNRSCICRFPAWRQVWFFIFVDVASAVAFLTKCHARRTSASQDSDLVSGGDWWEHTAASLSRRTSGFPLSPEVTVLHWCRERKWKGNLWMWWRQVNMTCLTSTWFKCRVNMPKTCSVGKKSAFLVSFRVVMYLKYIIIYLWQRRHHVTFFFTNAAIFHYLCMYHSKIVQRCSVWTTIGVSLGVHQ